VKVLDLDLQLFAQLLEGEKFDIGVCLLRRTFGRLRRTRRHLAKKVRPISHEAPLQLP